MDGLPVRVSVFAAFGEAFRFSRKRLFRPLSFPGWIRLAFLAFLGSTLELGIFTYNSAMLDLPGRPPAERPDAGPYLAFLFGHLSLIAIAVALIVAAFVFLRIVWVFVACRGRFMYLDGLFFPDKPLAAAWGENARQGNSLFGWKLFTGTLGFLFFLVTAVAFFLVLFERTLLQKLTGQSTTLLLGLAGVGLVAGFLSIYLEDFVVPLMWARREGVLRAWAGFFGLFARRPIVFLVYAPLRLLFSVATFLLTTLAFCLTCCLAVLPVVGEAVLLPLHVIVRAWPVFLLAGLDPRLRERLLPVLLPPVAAAPPGPAAPAGPPPAQPGPPSPLTPEARGDEPTGPAVEEAPAGLPGGETATAPPDVPDRP
ncbi:MAG: hypothetical protein KA419_05820 [Acidobacteria bacterium]|nr:hypothetical protein [Acidobacteriota bacterium]